MRRFRLLITTFAVLMGKISSAVPNGFEEETVFKIQNGQGTAFDLTNNGNLFVTYKQGKVFMYPFNDGNPGSRDLVLDMVSKVCTNGDRGIQSVTAHPNFSNNGFVYIYYTYKKYGNCDTYGDGGRNPVDRLSRFRLNNQKKLVDETVFLEANTYLRTRDGGGIIFGNDGKLWVTVGDHGFVSAAQSTASLHGAVIRLNDDGSIPGDNPYSTNPRCNENGDSPTDQDCPEIWANGLRNPFSLNKNMNKRDVTEFMINDVGASDWESCYQAGTKYEKSNYGWRLREGLCKIHTRSNCDNYPQNFEEPYHFYEHDSGGSGAMAAGTYIPDGWHSDYNGCYFYSDIVFHNIYLMCEGGNPCFACNPPRSDKKVEIFSNNERSVVAMKFLPYQGRQALYYIDIYEGTFRRVWKTGDNSNAKPIAQISYSQSNLAVEFDGGNSYDTDGNIVSYRWNFGDGSTTAAGVKVDHEYPESGVYEITLTVQDNEGLEDQETATIQVGKGPEPKIQLPRKESKFEVGDSFILMGYAIDDNGEEVPSTNLKWDILQWHGKLHTHEFTTVYGNEVTVYGAPPPEDPYSVTSSHLEIRLTATDRNGLSSTVSQDFWPALADISFTTDPPGLELLLMDDEFPFDSPTITFTTWAGHNLYVEAPQRQLRGEYEYEFESWSDGGARKHIVYVANSNNTPLKATYKISEIRRTHILMDRGDRIEKGNTKLSDTSRYSIKLEDDCTLAIREKSNTAVLARLGTEVSDDTCYAKVQGDCNFLIKSDKHGALFQSKTSAVANDGCFLAVFPGESNMNIGMFFGSQGTETPPSWMVELDDLPPTIAPTKLPTRLPTSAPTKLPTRLPTSAPTKLPTRLPTSAPTKLPTRLPTSAPTKLPTRLPTSTPTKLPTRLPTSTPTKSPTVEPTKLPTSSPTTCTLGQYNDPCENHSDCCSYHCSYGNKCRHVKYEFVMTSKQRQKRINVFNDDQAWNDFPGNLRLRRK